MPANLRRLAFAEVKVGGAGVDEDLEELIDVGHGGDRVYWRKFARMSAFCSERS